MDQSSIILGFLVVMVAGVFGQPPDPACFKLPGNKSPYQCCSAPMLVSDSVFESCRAAHPKPSSPPPMGKMNGCCISECILNNTGINVNGVPNQQKAIEYLTNIVKNDPELVQVVTNAVNTCAQMATTKMAEMQSAMPQPMNGEKVCHMQSGFMLGCVHGQAFKNCPSSKWTNDNDCNSIKAHVDKCGFLVPFKMG